MAKKRKTRSQKLASDTRHQNLSQSHPPLQEISLNDIGIKPEQKISLAASQPIAHSIDKEYSYVSHDLRKTTLITSAIILVELVLFFVVKL
jgi:hypothetical protein